VARGWESKNIESQQQEASRRAPAKRPRTADELALVERRRSLDMMRARVAAELSRASAPAHRNMLEAALSALDRQLAALG
jgi:hypothetical protein